MEIIKRFIISAELVSWLNFAAVALPTVLSLIGVFVSVETPTIDTRAIRWAWRVGLIGFGLLTSIVIYEQQDISSEISYTPSLTMIFQDHGEKPHFEILNSGRTNVYLWGEKLNDDSKVMMDAPRIISINTAYLIPTDNYVAAAIVIVGINGDTPMNYEIYLADDYNRKFTAKFLLHAFIKEGKLDRFDTQMIGLVRGNW
jgi:hypothetical protein